MTRARGLLVVMCVAAGCAMSTGGGQGTVSGDNYVDLEHNFAFRIPAGWVLEESRNPFRRPSYDVRFSSPERDSSVTARSGEVAATTCVEAARTLLAIDEGRLASEEPFTIHTPAGELPAWRGALQSSDGSRRGKVSLFCTGGRVVVLEASAASAQYEARRAEIVDIIQSFAYAGAPTIVRVAPRPTPTPAAYFVHVIRWRGQTLGQIARWYTGDYANWKKLTDLNDLTVDNAALRVGRQVRIPESLVTNRKPMPRPKPVAQPQAPSAPAAETPPAPLEPEAPSEDLPAVIGPR